MWFVNTHTRTHIHTHTLTHIHTLTHTHTHTHTHKLLLINEKCHADSVHNSSHKQVRHGQVIVAHTGVAIATVKQDSLVEHALTDNKIDDILVPRYEGGNVVRADTNLLDGDVHTAPTFKRTVCEIWHLIAHGNRVRSLPVCDILLRTVDKTFASPASLETK